MASTTTTAKMQDRTNDDNDPTNGAPDAAAAVANLTQALKKKTTTTKQIAHSTTTPNPNTLAPFNPTNERTQRTALHELFAFPKKDDNNNKNNPNDPPPPPPPVLFDLGCGDARVLIQAVRMSDTVRCVGLEYDPDYVRRAQTALVAQLTPSQRARIEIRHADLTDETWWRSRDGNDNNNDNDDDDHHSITQKPLSDLTLWDDATCIYIYLLPKGIRRIQHYLQALVDHRTSRRPRSSPKNTSATTTTTTTMQPQKLQIVACTFQIHGWQPVRVDCTGKSGVIKTYLYEFGEEGPPEPEQQEQQDEDDGQDES
eukprot:CAMPEP_0168781040 /NCGR_PEP_ID=MMETSP0725-20121227/8432_1 /TAXON_ID=265536 /ORGANISM="Amphiprora sp., Strain CCMP467" /LENGTH=312 /DNA_ID=CAMNT_0008830907 /DNA_START=51 /DNA_END=989 /DNA_ORIENTATION=-